MVSSESAQKICNTKGDRRVEKQKGRDQAEGEARKAKSIAKRITKKPN